MYLALQLQPGGILAWILVGIIAGAIASRLVAGRGFGCIVDLAVGIVGAFVGGFVAGLFVSGTPGLIGTIIVAIIGATLFLAVLKALGGGRL